MQTDKYKDKEYPPKPHHCHFCSATYIHFSNSCDEWTCLSCHFKHAAVRI